MPKRPDFYCDFYCAACDGLREPGTPGDSAGSHPSPRDLAGAPRACLDGSGRAAVPRSSGSLGLEPQTQRLIPVGRSGIDDPRVWQTSPIGSTRRGR